MKQIRQISLALLAFCLCANFGTGENETSVSGARIKPAINFKGSILDNTGETFKAEHITVSGLYKQIPVYAKPTNMQNEKYNPTINTTRLDLAEVAKISIPNPSTIYQFNNRKYIEVNVTSKDAPHTQSSYLIENSKKILCDQVNAAGPIERELQFQAIQDINISTYEKNEPEETAQKDTKKTDKSVVKKTPETTTNTSPATPKPSTPKFRKRQRK